MRILHIITNTDLGGAQRIVIDLCASAVKDGHTVAVASMEGGPMWSLLPESVVRHSLPHMVKPIKPLKEIPCFFEIRAVIKNFNPDIIHLHSSKAALLGRLATPPRLQKRIVYTVHGFDTIRVRNRIFLPLEKIMQKKCGAIIPVSEYDYKNLRTEGITHKLTLIRNAVPDTPAFSEHELPLQIKEPLLKAKAEGKKIIMTIARIALPKRLDIFTDIARSLKDDNCVFFWIGSPTDSTLEGDLKKYQETASVIFTGDIPNASRLISYTDVFVLFSDYEGLPITILEAMAKGKPVIASNVGGISELVDDNTGSLIPVGKTHDSVEASVKAIKTLISDKKLIQEKGEKARKKYESYFTLDTMWKKYFSVYSLLADE
ncbi:MAG: glycosyltransferase family 4 protein [Treponemataceae bacterium]|nr:glycosyltransferase family 4 protein [Treponemataceae bacterium]